MEDGLYARPSIHLQMTLTCPSIVHSGAASPPALSLGWESCTSTTDVLPSASVLSKPRRSSACRLSLNVPPGTSDVISTAVAPPNTTTNSMSSPALNVSNSWASQGHGRVGRDPSMVITCRRGTRRTRFARLSPGSSGLGACGPATRAGVVALCDTEDAGDDASGTAGDDIAGDDIAGDDIAGDDIAGEGSSDGGEAPAAAVSEALAPIAAMLSMYTVPAPCISGLNSTR